MSITFPAAYTAKVRSSAITVDWLFKLYYDDTNYICLSSIDRTVGTDRYYGIIVESGMILSEINLQESKASTSSVSIQCIDKWKTGTLSEELYGGTNKYLNKKVIIRECVNDETTLANCPLLYEGRLINVTINNNVLNLEFEQASPWDHIYIPQDKEASKGIFQPLAYGDFENNTSGDYCLDKKVFPCPTVGAIKNNLYVIAHKAVASGLVPHYYDTNLNQFHPVTSASTATSVIAGVDQFGCPVLMERSFKFRPTQTNSDDDMTDTAYAYDDDIVGATYAYVDFSVGSGSGVNEDFKVDVPEPSLGYASALTINAHARVDISAVSGNPAQVDIDDKLYSRNNNIVTRADGNGIGSTTTAAYSADIQSNYASAGNLLPSVLYFDCSAQAGAGASITAKARIYNVFYDVTYKMDVANVDYDVVTAEISKIPFIYLGEDGLDQSYTDGSGLAQLPHEIYRDLLERFCDLDYDNDYMEGFSVDNTYLSDHLNSVRSGWNCRWWLLDQTELKEILQQLQFEGCFIAFFVADSDGSGNAGMRFIWVHDLYEAGDVSQTFTEDDYDVLDISITDLKNIITKTSYNYDRHPALDQYLETQTRTNDAARTAWNFDTTNDKDNYETHDLDFHVHSSDKVYNSGSHSDPNDCLALYYDNIQANPRIIVNTTIANKSMMNVTRGDIIKFNDSNVDPYGKSWADLYFMIVSEERTKDSLRITAREVYQA